jgi:hypothetical protein
MLVEMLLEMLLERRDTAGGAFGALKNNGSSEGSQ